MAAMPSSPANTGTNVYALRVRHEDEWHDQKVLEDQHPDGETTVWRIDLASDREGPQHDRCAGERQYETEEQSPLGILADRGEHNRDREHGEPDLDRSTNRNAAPDEAQPLQGKLEPDAEE